MGKKLSEMNGGELAAALVAISAPIDNLLSDQEFSEAILRCSGRGDKKRPFLQKTQLGVLLHVLTELSPILFGEKHIGDVARIISVIEGVSEKELLKMPAPQIIKEVIDAWRTQVGPFFGYAESQA